MSGFSLRRPRWLGLSLVLVLLCTGVATLVVTPRTSPRAPLVATPTSPRRASRPLPVADNPIAAENMLPGTTAWQLEGGFSTALQAYASATSISPGQTLTFYVSTASAGTLYTAQIYRLGWYGGLGGRLMTTLSGFGQAQGVYLPITFHLLGCQRCTTDPQTHLIEANWQPSFSLTIPATWTTGLYEAKLVAATGQQAAVPFTVRGDLHSTAVAVFADNTTEAYNQWGGYSLYYGPGHTAATHADAVSFDRPYDNWYDGPGNGLAYEIDALHFLERNGYDVSYLSSTDLHANPGQLLTHQVFISLGHDEYWSYQMRNGVENARAQGVSLVFLSGNDVYWQVRYAKDSHGVAYRTLICYKSLADPLLGRDNARVTVRWRDWPVLRPENALLGAMYAGDSSDALVAWPWHTAPAYSSWYTGTGLQADHNYGCNLVGPEWDSVFNNGQTPAHLTILGASPAFFKVGRWQTANTTLYTASSGALVFDAGSIYWTLALDSFHLWTVANASQNACFAHAAAIPAMQTLLVRILGAMVA